MRPQDENENRYRFSSQLFTLLKAALFAIILATAGAAQQPGDLDTTFDNDGKRVEVSIPSSAGGETVLVQPDGRVVTVGTSTNGGALICSLTRHLPDGTLDPSFGSGGVAGWGPAAVSLDCLSAALQGDGKIVAAGKVYTGSNNEFALVRFNANGSLDSAFGSGGMVTTHVGTSDGGHALSVAIQADGKIVAAGFSYDNCNYLGDCETKGVLARYTADGSPDATFDVDGIATTTFAADEISSIAIQLDGKIVALGPTHGVVPGGGFPLARYNTDGSLDTSFGSGGTVFTRIETLTVVGISIGIQSNGKIIVGSGYSHSDVQNWYLALTRYSASGTFDSSFGSDGKVITLIRTFPLSVSIQSDGKIVAAGTTSNGSNNDFALVRFNANGSLDTTFGGGDGISVVDFNNSDDYAAGMALDPLGRAVVVGTSNGTLALARFLLSNTVTVTNTNDSGAGSLRQAIADAAPGATIDFDANVFSTPRTITLTSGQLVIDKNLSIHGPGANLLSISGNHLTRVFKINGANTVTFDGMTIKEGAAEGGAGIDNGGTLTVNNSTISGNDSFLGESGGGISNSGTLLLNNTTLSGNAVHGESLGCGGGIYNVGLLNLTNSIVSGNNATSGGGVCNSSLVGVSGSGTMTIDGGSFSGNSAWSGGGIFSSGILTVSNSAISNNSADGGGGIYNDLTLAISNSIISGNFAASAGGGIYNNGTLTISYSTVSDNYADITNGGGSGGGGIFNESGTLTVINSTISGNVAQSTGAVLSGGGGIYNHFASLIVSNSTISGNAVTGNGLSIFGGGILIDSPDDRTEVIYNSIIAGNSSSQFSSDISGTISQASHNLIGDAASSGGVQNGVNGNIVGVNPLLGPLANNGGPTFTHALLPGSPAINAGDNCVLIENGCSFTHPALTTDQRGLSRVGRVDIGAFERQTSDTSGVAPFDFDGDGRTDVSVYRPSDGNWYILNSGAAPPYSVTNWGNSTDIPAPADFDNDGKTDIAVYRPLTGQWFVLNSLDSSFTVANWGTAGDRPVPRDFDGDGKADISVYRPSNGTWYIFRSNGTGWDIVQWGAVDDVPVPGPYDSDSKNDFAVFRPSTGQWFVLPSSGSGGYGVPWGVAGDRPVPADYDGDGNDDIAVYRPSDGNWYIYRSDGTGYDVINWGVNTDTPVPGDYDGDGKADVAQYRPSTGDWFVLKSSGGHDVTSWGVSTDKPLPASYSGN